MAHRTGPYLPQDPLPDLPRWAHPRAWRQGVKSLRPVRAWIRHRRQGHVVMLHVGRCGSTVLGDLLNQHPSIGWGKEIYQHLLESRQREDGTFPTLDVIDPVAHARARAYSCVAPHFGFEVKFFHLRQFRTALGQYIDALETTLPNVRYVVLRRRNCLRMAVSTLRAHQTRRWHATPGERVDAEPLRIDPDRVYVNRRFYRLEDLLDEIDWDFDHLDTVLEDRAPLQLSYEADVADNPRRAYTEVCRHMGLEAPDVDIRFRRTNPFPLAALIANFDEVARRLRKTRHAWMLDD